MRNKQTLIFVCIENACRSQMAEAFAKRQKNENIEVYSAGSRPSGRVNKKAIASMRALGYDMNHHVSSGIDALPDITFDWFVSMGCGDHCPSIRAKHRATWDIPDPKHMDSQAFDTVRDLIREKVTQLIGEIKNGSPAK